VRPQDHKPIFRTPFVPKEFDNGPGTGVELHRIVEDSKTPPKYVYDPYHPNALKSGQYAGYVEYPNVNIVNEMTDLINASRAYEANATVIQGAKEMFNSALEIGR
jgi:flagellar basal-body rod protein FlgC